MQTFLPYPSYNLSARVLDRQRLGKQRVEGYQILRTLYGLSASWRNHPAVLMWRGYECQLVAYIDAICREWEQRGYNDSVSLSVSVLHKQHCRTCSDDDPTWLGNSEFHAAHRSNLLRKNPDYYGQFGWNEPNDLLYVWPVKKGTH